MLLTLFKCVKYQGVDQAIKMYCVYWLFQIPSFAHFIYDVTNVTMREVVEAGLDLCVVFV